jgi:hypothetical protein
MIKDYSYFENEPKLSIEDHQKLQRFGLTIISIQSIIFIVSIGIAIYS